MKFMCSSGFLQAPGVPWGWAGLIFLAGCCGFELRRCLQQSCVCLLLPASPLLNQERWSWGAFQCNLCFIPDKYLPLIWEAVITAAGSCRGGDANGDEFGMSQAAVQSRWLNPCLDWVDLLQLLYLGWESLCSVWVRCKVVTAT